MSNDLISRESIIKKLENALLNDDLTIGEQGLLSDIVSFVAIETTTYNIDKVVKELESFAKLAENRYKNNTSPHALQEHRCWVKAIEIVKQGGVSDDMCECRLFKGYKFLHKTSCGNVFDMQNGFKYCPYCGKKIKVVE